MKVGRIVKNAKVFTSILLVLITVLSILPVTAFAANPASDFEYRVMGSDVRIDKYKGRAREVVIPDTIEGKRVRVIGPEAFRNTSIVSVKMPRDLSLIKKDAFAGCRMLKIVIFQRGPSFVYYEGNVFDRVGVHAFEPPAKVIIPSTDRVLPAGGKAVEWLGGRFDVIRMDRHKCQDELPIRDGKCDICGRKMNPVNSALELSAAAAKTAAVVGKTVVVNTVKTIKTTTRIANSILSLFIR